MILGRRRFLQLIGLAPLAVPTKSYSFLGGILRPRAQIIAPVLAPGPWMPVYQMTAITLEGWKGFSQITHFRAYK